MMINDMKANELSENVMRTVSAGLWIPEAQEKHKTQHTFDGLMRKQEETIKKAEHPARVHGGISGRW